jgi:hypothetical protein
MLRPLLAKLHEGPGFLLWTLILDRRRRSFGLYLDATNSQAKQRFSLNGCHWMSLKIETHFSPTA